jgi:putative ABC transport system ATP-binding protein
MLNSGIRVVNLSTQVPEFFGRCGILPIETAPVAKRIPMNDIIIQTQNLARHHSVGQNAVRALDGVDLEIRRGEFIALVGPSGSGKSTLLNLIGGLDRPTGGEVIVDGLSLGKASEKELVQYRRGRIGFIFQSFNLLPTRSAVENVEVPLMLAEVSRGERRERALKLLEPVGLAQRAHHRPNEMSGGEMQRVAIARALANNPLLLLADEPTGNLDSQTGKVILEMLRNLLTEQHLTLVLVTHDPQVAARADRIVHLRDGRIQRIETPTQSTLEAHLEVQR